MNKDEVIHSVEGAPLVRTIRDSAGNLMILVAEDGREVLIQQEDAEALAHALLDAAARVKSENR